jgi:hypothetical protein
MVESTWRKTFPSATFCTINLTGTHPGTNKDLRDERQVTKFLRPEKANLTIKFN